MALKDDVKLNIYELDDALINFPALYEDWSSKWANAVGRRDDIKFKLDNLKNDKDQEIRKDPEGFGWEGTKDPTEVFIKAAIARDSEVKDLEEELLEAIHDVGKFASAKEVCERTLKAIEILADLYKNSYWTGVSKTDWAYKEAMAKKNTEAQQESLKTSPRLRRPNQS